MSGYGFVAPVDRVARLGLVLNTFDDLIAEGAGAVTGPDIYVDELEDSAGIDAGNSTGETYNAAGYVSNVGGYTADQCSGGTPVGSATDGGFPLANAFADNGNTSAWRSDDSGGAVSGTSYIGYNFGSAVAVRRINLLQGATGVGWTADGHASSVIVRTSSDGSSWTNRATFSGLSTSSNSGTWENLDLSDYGTHQYWSLLLNSAITTGRWHVAEVEMLALNTPPALDVRSASIALAGKTACQFVGRFSQSDPDAVYVSNDGGSTWDEITLTDHGDYGSGVSLLSGQVAMTGGGDDIRFRYTKAEGTECRLEGWGGVFGGA